MPLLFALLACASVTPAAPAPDPTPVDASPTAPVAAPPPVTPTEPPSPADQYAACHDRMELPEADAECKADADCAPTGCGGEVCAPASTTGLMYTCEDQPCFHVVTGCGCHEGRCTWTVAEAPALRPMIQKKGPAPQ